MKKNNPERILQTIVILVQKELPEVTLDVVQDGEGYNFRFGSTFSYWLSYRDYTTLKVEEVAKILIGLLRGDRRGRKRKKALVSLTASH